MLSIRDNIRVTEKSKFIIFGIIYVTSCISFIFYLYGQAKYTIDEELNHRLYHGALMATAILGEHYHDHLVSKASKTEQEDWDSIERLTDYSRQLDLNYIYTVIEKDGIPILVSSSASQEELDTNSYVRFFDPYPDASHKLLVALHENRVIWTDYTDHWGEFRAVFVPRVSDDGTRYIAGAEVSMEDYYRQLHSQEMHLAGFSIFLFIDFSIFIAVYLTHIRYNLFQTRCNAAALKEAKEASEQASEAKSHFVSTVSHEIRTPLNGISGASELLADSELNRQQKEYLRIIQSSTKSLLMLVNSLLDLSKIEAGKSELEAEEFELRPMIQNVLHIIRPQLKHDSVSLNAFIDETIPRMIITDRNKLQQVLLNLLGNAAKFTESGDIQLQLTQSEASPQTDDLELYFAVKDTGIGISPAQQGQLFQPFTQLGSAKRYRNCGTGLGLSICQSFVQLMGGKIHIESEEGRGSVFSFKLPCKGGAISQTGEQTESSGHLSYKGRTLEILVADDNQVSQYLIKMMLGQLGHPVTLVHDGLEALQAVQKKDYDLVLMDIHMNKMDGVEAVGQIRSFSGIRQPYIVAYTASAYSEDIRRFKACGMNDVLIKPVKTKDIEIMLSRFFEERPEDETITTGST